MIFVRLARLISTLCLRSRRRASRMSSTEVTPSTSRISIVVVGIRDLTVSMFAVADLTASRHDYGIIVPKHVGQNIIGFLLNADYLPKE
uniref:Uncharacterized protein n=1 Tax=Timema poppense TaxID=170557 RepID=A0A7R9HC60_TIMPO|nr:unnamed protein product [Timema poppensis]